MKISLGTHIINVDSLCPPLAVMKAKHIDTKIQFSFHCISFTKTFFMCLALF